MKKSFAVELRYESYLMLDIEADNVEEAEQMAWAKLESDSGLSSRYGNWSLNSIEEQA